MRGTISRDRRESLLSPFQEKRQTPASISSISLNKISGSGLYFQFLRYENDGEIVFSVCSVCLVKDVYLSCLVYQVATFHAGEMEMRSRTLASSP